MFDILLIALVVALTVNAVRLTERIEALEKRASEGSDR